MVNTFKSFLFLAFVLLLGCTSNKTHSDAINLSSLKEGDTLEITHVLPNLNLWMEYHSRKGSRISLTDFMCSGVVLHQGDLPMLDSTVDHSKLVGDKFLVFSPNKTKFIDLFSITMKNNIRNSNSLLLPFASDIDQQVVLGYADGRRTELFFCGPEQLVESADWLNEHQVILTLTSFLESQHHVELYLYDLEMGVFTNFLLNKNIENSDHQCSFIDYWISKKNTNN